MQLLLSTLCMALTSAVVGYAYYQKQQFYPAVVYITKSNASMAVIYIQFFVIVFMFGKLLRKIFLGTLRAAEFEHLLERFWYALTETCLAFTVFRDDFNPRFVALFTVLLFLKSFHWLAEERVDFMERSPVLGWLFHIRVASLLSVLGILDYMLLAHAYQSTLVRGPTVQLVFGFEYAILLTIIASTAIKYVLHAAEMRTDTPWENKAVFLLYTELVIGMIKVILYVLFVVIMAKIYALPMFVFRPMFFTIRNFKKALSDVIMSRRAIRNMNTLYPDATAEELRLSDNICIICREDMINHSKKLPCGHIFHTTCLRSWFQRQQTCPTCRLNILRAPAANSTAMPRQADVAAAQPAAPAAAAAAAAGAAAPAAAQGTPDVAAQAPNVRNEAARAAAAAAVNAPINPFEQLGANPFANTMPQSSALPPGFPAMPMVPPPPPPPFMMAPFMTPYAVPPPPMPIDLTSFSDEELAAMEGNERHHVEERIKLLRNIQLMLDAAGVLMNSYQIVAARAAQAPPAATAAAAAAATAGAAKTATTTPPPDVIATTTTMTIAGATGVTITTTTSAAATDGPSTSRAAAANAETAATLISAIPAAAIATAPTLVVDKHNEVTIEDLGGEDNEECAPTATYASVRGVDSTESGELSELRKRRLKFLEERNKSTTSTD